MIPSVSVVYSIKTWGVKDSIHKLEHTHHLNEILEQAKLSCDERNQNNFSSGEGMPGKGQEGT